MLVVKSKILKNSEISFSTGVPVIQIRKLVLIFLAQNFIPKKNKNVADSTVKKGEVQKNSSTKSVSKEEEEFLSANYELVKHYLKERMLSEAKEKIQNELTYPGQVKVTVIRETRAVNIAR